MIKYPLKIPNLFTYYFSSFLSLPLGHRHLSQHYVCVFMYLYTCVCVCMYMHVVRVKSSLPFCLQFASISGYKEGQGGTKPG